MLNAIRTLKISTCVLLCSISTVKADTLRVVASINPIHSLVAQVMEGIGTPQLLIKAAGSPHSYALKPSDARTLSEANVVIWIGEEFESVLRKPIANLAASTHVVTVSSLKKIRLLKGRSEHAHEHSQHDKHGHDKHAGDKHEDEDEDDKHHGEHGEFDMHLWLDPENAKTTLDAVANTLSSADPKNRERFMANAEKAKSRIDTLSAKIHTLIEPVENTPFVVFHDAYRYFEERFHIRATAAITINPERRPGAKRLVEIRKSIKSQKAKCVFAEPQFAPKLVEAVIDGTGAKMGTLDPLGANVPVGPGAYDAVLLRLANSLSECLGD